MLKITFYTAMFFLWFIFKLLYCYNMNLNNFFQSIFLTFIFSGWWKAEAKKELEESDEEDEEEGIMQSHAIACNRFKCSVVLQRLQSISEKLLIFECISHSPGPVKPETLHPKHEKSAAKAPEPEIEEIEVQKDGQVQELRWLPSAYLAFSLVLCIGMYWLCYVMLMLYILHVMAVMVCSCLCLCLRGPVDRDDINATAVEACFTVVREGAMTKTLLVFFWLW